ncbi:MAG: polysaccharide deacetylase [Firmicutes bacterium]|nr:polysaccharide deacetylase [Bacillota bacterium]
MPKKTKVRFWSAFAVCGIMLVAVAGGNYTHSEQVIKKVPTTHKVIALTFDDGPHPKITPTLLAVLKEKEVKATFFVLGMNAEKFPLALKSIVDAGEEVANHGYSHRYSQQINDVDFLQEVISAEEVISKIAPKPSLYRPPGGGYSDRRVMDLKQRGYTTVLWTVDTRDWEGRSSQEIIDTVVKNVKPGDIVLMHEGDFAKATPAAVGTIIDKLRDKGYSFVTVSELLQYYEIRE